jgi:glycine C-acetyltransferase
VSASLRAFTLLEENQQLLEALAENTAYFRRKLADVGFDIPAGDHPIVPIMLGDAKRAVRYAERLLALGVYVIAFSYPVVPKGTARIRTQVSAAHSKADLDYTVEKFAQVRDEIEGST